jgi:hypothetical protein
VIVIPIELHPFGFAHNKRDLGRIVIVNDGTGSATRGNYSVRVEGKGGRVIRDGLVLNWPRKSKPVFELVIAALESCGYKGAA